MGKFEPVCAELFWCDKFIAPSLILNMIPSLDTGYVRELEPELYGASGSRTL